jgi:transcriptional regulator with XRE-family HTH domain
MNIGERIKAARKTKDISQQDVADKIGMNRVQYNRIETGKSEPTVPTLERIAEALDISVIDFFSNEATADINSYSKSLVEKVKLIEQLDEVQRKSIFTFIDTALSNKRLKDTLNNALNLAH